MNRADALKALDSAISERLILEYDQLANGFMGDAATKQTAKNNFRNGVEIHLDALAFAAEVISQKFTD